MRINNISCFNYRYLSIFVLFSFISSLAAITIEFKNTNDTVRLTPIEINGMNYYNLNDLRSSLRTANHIIDYEHNKVSFSVFDTSVILYINTLFASSRGRLSNMSHSVVQRNGEFLLPETFLTHTMTDFFPNNISWSETNRVLLTERPTDRRINTIVIDPGHGGRDPGAVGRRHQEKTIVLNVAQKLKTQLERELGVRVLLTRTRDEFVSLRDRTNFANTNNADLFISLHTNAARNRSANGVEVFFLSTAQTDDARAVEALENQVVYDFEGGEEAVRIYDDLAFILADLQQAQHLEESSDLAIRLQTELIRSTRAADRGVKQAGFFVLRGAFMPAVLVEVGFISNEAEERRLATSSHQDLIVSAIVEGIRSFKLKYDYLW
ncbi:MAG: N-acetylmuramoyl-L-alanine amidase [Candidatus Cloacimonetes bacterium]|nr:N-acetylmuramoyl-L-alanine amidase [Candidatus Cloacimonadota bacterium]